MKARIITAIVAASAIFFSAATVPAGADGLNVSPVRVLLAANQRAASITLTNAQSRAEIMRVESFAWDQVDGKDELTPTDELLVVPPIFNVAPNSVKVVRLGLRVPSSATRERSYRIYLTEVPPENSGQNSIAIAYRFSVPVFLPPTLHSAPKPQWSAKRLDADHIVLHVQNDGDAHVRVSTVKVYSDASRTKLLRDQAVAGYVLAGRTGDFKLDVKNAPPAATLVVGAATGDDLDDIAAVVPVTASF
jgi:fimbrial chaperone protein